MAARPAWFWIIGSKDAAVAGLARVPETRWSDAGLQLRIWEEGDALRVSELVRGIELPSVCYERHIQAGGVFCTGLDLPALRRHKDVERWWSDLAQYIRCQSIASDLGIWPLTYALDHGDAGVFHLRALRLAAVLGIEDEYLAAYMDRPSWLTGRGLHLLGGRYAKGARQLRKWRPRIRKPGKNTDKLFELVRAEFHRREKLLEFWEEGRVVGLTCCGSMRDCPLRKAGAAVRAVPKRAANA